MDKTLTTGQLTLKWLGIDTYRETVIYMHKNCLVCQAEGFEVHARIKVSYGDKSILATINHINNGVLQPNEASLSQYAWNLLGAKEGEKIQLSYAKPLLSLSYVRSKIYGHPLKPSEIREIIQDIAEGHYTNIHAAAFLTACASNPLNKSEIIDLTRSMKDAGECLSWDRSLIVDKHCVGGLPGNRTSPIVVPIVAAFGLTMPKTSSRAITSPAGTADTMETLAPVALSIQQIRRVVEQEQGCIVWGGAVNLSPADDIIIRVEKVLNLDSVGQLIASVLSKKLSAGSNHVVIDIPVGPTAKIRSIEHAMELQYLLTEVARAVGLTLNIIQSDGRQPVGRGIGPALEAYDVLNVLQNQADAPLDLRERALTLAGHILEFSPEVRKGQGFHLAEDILDSGRAWQKFQAICEAQGGLREPPIAKYTHTIASDVKGRVSSIQNRSLAYLAKLAGAPNDKAAGVVLHAPLEKGVSKGEPLFSIHSDSKGALNYALSYLDQVKEIVQVEEHE